MDIVAAVRVSSRSMRVFNFLHQEISQIGRAVRFAQSKEGLLVSAAGIWLSAVCMCISKAAAPKGPAFCFLDYYAQPALAFR